MLTCGVFLASIPVECLGRLINSAHHGLLVLVVVLICANIPQYLIVFRETARLTAIIKLMLIDVLQLIVLYSVFLFRISGDPEQTLLDTVIAILLMYLTVSRTLV